MFREYIKQNNIYSLNINLLYQVSLFNIQKLILQSIEGITLTTIRLSHKKPQHNQEHLLKNHIIVIAHSTTTQNRNIAINSVNKKRRRVQTHDSSNNRLKNL